MLKHISLLFNIKALLSIFLFCLFLQKSLGQYSYPGYIVTEQDDTLYGYCGINSLQNQCYFKDKKDGNSIMYTPYEIKSIKITGGSYYVSKEILKDGVPSKLFLEFLIEGEVDLYALNYDGIFFIQKDGYEMLELDDNIYTEHKSAHGKTYLKHNTKYIGLLKVYLQEAPEVYSKIDNISFLSQNKLIELSEDYHNAVCSDYKCINYKKKILKTKVKIEAHLGIHHYNRYYAKNVGGIIHLGSPKLINGLFIRLGIIYSAYPIYMQYEFNDLEDGMKIPLSFCYAMGGGKLKPTIAFGWPTGQYHIGSIGPGLNYSFSENWELGINMSLDVPLWLLYDYSELLDYTNFGQTISVGLIRKL